MSSSRVFFGVLILAALAGPAVADWVQSYKVTSGDYSAHAGFGMPVAIGGNTAIVGAPREHHYYATGSAYLFDVGSGVQLAKLTSNDGAENDYFGYSVAVSGNTAIVGVPYDDYNTGSAYLFDVTSGLQLFKLTADDGAEDDFFGSSVAVSGNTAIVGATNDSVNKGGHGSAYVFDVLSGRQLAKLTASDGARGDSFGWRVAISGNTAIVGATGDDDNGSSSGSAYLFDIASGLQLAKLTANDGAANDEFGWSVAISGNTAIVGAPYDGYDTGSAYLFDVTSGVQVARLTPDDPVAGGCFGSSVAVSGNTAIVGVPYDDYHAGSAYLFDVTSGLQLAKLTADDSAEDDFFGLSVAMSGNTIIVGAPGDDDNGPSSGSAYLFVIPEPSTLLMLSSLLPALSVAGWLRRKHGA